MEWEIAQTMLQQNGTALNNTLYRMRFYRF